MTEKWRITDKEKNGYASIAILLSSLVVIVLL